ncbi:HIRAN domain-containing protein [Vibrio hyugaensis]|uniref:HIRAN domain-containing protein n=1 Tax=Vibrio hyugaensis TaxID=1534743 RepID=UPI0005EE556E|nr:HIRAN domain-containing protein [Vibrio hyugaensis]
MKSVFVIWKDSDGGMWHPVAKLTRTTDGFRFNYTKGADHKNFIAFPRMDDLSKVYHSATLFSFFTNRLIPTNRPEFKKMLEWSDIDPEGYDELDLLGVSGGARKTDEFRIISEPEVSQRGQYKIRFFVSGIRHLDEVSATRVTKLQVGEELKLLLEDSNPHDCMAVLLATGDNVPIGYCPKYFNCDIRALLAEPELDSYSLRVVKLNEESPAQFRVLCEFVTKWPQGFTPLVSEEYLAHTTQCEPSI